jgi:hypothetical protein
MITLHDAVYAAYPNTAVVRGNDVNLLTAENVNGQQIELNPSTIMAKFEELQSQETQKEQAAKEAKSSALAKLSALGLTADEIKALIGA